MFPFKYKLTILFTVLITLLLAGSFLIIQNRLKTEYTITIKKELASTQKIIEEQMLQRKHRLIDFAQMLENNNLIKIMLRDDFLDRPTRDDIIESEILSNFSAVDFIMLVDGNSNILATNKLAKLSEVHIKNRDTFKEGIKGRPQSSYFINKNQIIQLIYKPIYDIDLLTGILIIGFTIDSEFIETINDVYGINIGFMEDHTIILKNLWDDNLIRDDKIKNDFLNISSSIQENIEPGAQDFKSDNESFIYTLSSIEDQFIPRYLLLKSLDKSLIFVKNIRDNLLFITFFGLILGLIISTVFSLSVTHPITQLEEGAIALENENYMFRVKIDTNDEFNKLGNTFNNMIGSIGEKEKIRSVLNKSVSKEIAEELLKGNIQLGGDEKEATILFTDVRDFTSISEGLAPGKLLNLLNEYLTRVSHSIEVNKGVIDKYIGDAVMALFGLPLPIPNDAEAGILSALEIINTVKKFNLEVSNEIGKEFKVGIGISTGLLVAGNMGAANRMNYTVLGDEVNLASRIESLTKYYNTDILISQSTFDKIDRSNKFCLREVDRVTVKGKSLGITIYDVLDEYSVEIVSEFSKFHKLLHDKKFLECFDILKILKKKYEDDGPTNIFINRITSYIEDPLRYENEYVNGSYVFNTK